MKSPIVGKPVRGSRTGRPIMVLLDLLGRRMTLRVMWELSRAQQPLSFRALQAAAETNPALLNTRLKELRESHLVAHGGEGYALTEEGQSLMKLLLPLVGWAETWADQDPRTAKSAIRSRS
jgi:DNA-binding HxlR family transcriptional regulator